MAPFADQAARLKCALHRDYPTSKMSLKKAAKSCGRYVAAAIRQAGAESQAFALDFLVPIAGFYLAEDRQFKIVRKHLVVPSAHRPVGPSAIMGESPLEIDIAFLRPARILKDKGEAYRKDDYESGAGDRADDWRNENQQESENRECESRSRCIFPALLGQFLVHHVQLGASRPHTQGSPSLLKRTDTIIVPKDAYNVNGRL